jgi:hypothetical protein
LLAWAAVVIIDAAQWNLQLHNAPGNTSALILNSFYVTTSNITSTLCSSVATLGPAHGFAPANGAMALLCANVNPNTIQMLGRWCCDEMLGYLHL